MTSFARERTQGDTGGTMFRDLPESPNLDHLRKQAKALLRALKQSHPEAKLTEAQHAVARSYGFASWAKLRAHIDSIPNPAFGGGTVAGPGAPVVPEGGFGQFA